MLKTNSFLSTKERNSGRKSGKKQPLSVFEPRLLLAFIVAGLVGAQSAAGQAPAEKEITTQEVPSQFTVQVQRNMVLVKAVVRDSKGNPIPGLRKTSVYLTTARRRRLISSASSRPAVLQPWPPR